MNETQGIGGYALAARRFWRRITRRLGDPPVVTGHEGHDPRVCDLDGWCDEFASRGGDPSDPRGVKARRDLPRCSWHDVDVTDGACPKGGTFCKEGWI